MEKSLENGSEFCCVPVSETDDASALKPSTSGSTASNRSLTNSIWVSTSPIENLPSSSSSGAWSANPASDTRPSSPATVVGPLFPSSLNAPTFSSSDGLQTFQSNIAASTSSWKVTETSFVAPTLSTKDDSLSIPSSNGTQWTPSYKALHLLDSLQSSQMRRNSCRYRQRSLILLCRGCTHGLQATLLLQRAGRTEVIKDNKKNLDDNENSDCLTLETAADAVMFGIQNCKQILRRHPFTIMASHESLLRIFDPDRPIPGVFNPRYTPFAMELQSYRYDIEYEEDDSDDFAEFI